MEFYIRTPRLSEIHAVALLCKFIKGTFKEVLIEFNFRCVRHSNLWCFKAIGNWPLEIDVGRHIWEVVIPSIVDKNSKHSHLVSYLTHLYFLEIKLFFGCLAKTIASKQDLIWRLDWYFVHEVWFVLTSYLASHIWYLITQRAIYGIRTWEIFHSDSKAKSIFIDAWT